MAFRKSILLESKRLVDEVISMQLLESRRGRVRTVVSSSCSTKGAGTSKRFESFRRDERRQAFGVLDGAVAEWAQDRPSSTHGQTQWRDCSLGGQIVAPSRPVSASARVVD